MFSIVGKQYMSVGSMPGVFRECCLDMATARFPLSLSFFRQVLGMLQGSNTLLMCCDI